MEDLDKLAMEYNNVEPHPYGCECGLACTKRVLCVDTGQHYCVKGDTFQLVGLEECNACKEETPY